MIPGLSHHSKRVWRVYCTVIYPKGPCTQIVYTLAPKYPSMDYFKAKVYAIWVHGLGIYSLDSCSDFHVVDFDEPLNQEGFGVKELGILV